MQLYGHPWSINTRKVLATLAEKGREVPMSLVMIPTGEHKQPEYVRLQPFGKVPVLDDDGFVLYETRAINAYLDATSPGGAALTPRAARDRARMDQWVNVAESYFIPHAHPLIVELLFRRYLGGEQDAAVIAAGRANMGVALDTIDRALAERPFLAGEAFSLADIHWMPYLDYLSFVGEGEHVAGRPNVAAWWGRISARPSWQKVARGGLQPYAPDATLAALEKVYR